MLKLLSSKETTMDLCRILECFSFYVTACSKDCRPPPSNGKETTLSEFKEASNCFQFLWDFAKKEMAEASAAIICDNLKQLLTSIVSSLYLRVRKSECKIRRLFVTNSVVTDNR